MPREWARSRSCSRSRSRSRGRRQGLSKRESKVERRKTRRQEPSEILLVLLFPLVGLLLLFVARHRVLGLRDLADLAHVLLLLWRRRSTKTADTRPSAVPNHRRALAEHLQAPRQQAPSTPAAPAARSTRSLAARVDTLRYSDSPLDIGGGVDAAVVTSQSRSHVCQWFEGEVEMGEIDSGSCSQDANPSLPPSPLPSPSQSHERETASVRPYASPSLGPHLPLHDPCAPKS